MYFCQSGTFIVKTDLPRLCLYHLNMSTHLLSFLPSSSCSLPTSVKTTNHQLRLTVPLIAKVISLVESQFPGSVKTLQWPNTVEDPSNYMGRFDLKTYGESFCRVIVGPKHLLVCPLGDYNKAEEIRPHKLWSHRIIIFTPRSSKMPMRVAGGYVQSTLRCFT